jgi:hypothetical protein
MTVYRDDLEAAVHRAEALEAELRRVREKQREDRAGYLVKVTELEADLKAEQTRLQEIEARLEGEPGAAPAAVDDLAAQLTASREKLSALAADVAAVTAKHRAAPRRRGAVLVVVGAALAFVASAAAVVIYLAATSARRESTRREAFVAIAHGNYPDSVAAATALERLAIDRDDPELLADAAWVRASMALELGTDDDEAAATLVQRALQAGAAQDHLALARVAIRLSRGELLDADRILQENTASTGDYAPELIYLRGLWYLRRNSAEDAMRRFVASSDASPGDVRYQLAHARALYADSSYAEALTKLAGIENAFPENVEAKLLRAKTLIETNANPGGGDLLARQVIEQMRQQAAPGQIGWAWLLRARRLAKQLDEHALQEELGVLRTLLDSARSSRPVRDAEFSALVASTLLAMNEPEAARPEAEAAVVLSQGVDRYRLLLVEALLATGDVAAAGDQLRNVMSPDEPEAALLRGRVALAQGDLDAAQAALETAARGERVALQARILLARLYLSSYAPDEAINSLEAARAAFPFDDATLFDLLGDAYAMKGGTSARVVARSDYVDALRLRGDDVHALIGLAELELEGTNALEITDAIGAAEGAAAATGLEPALEARLDALKGRFALEFEGDATAAVDLFTKALALDDRLADAHLGLGFSLQDASRGREACEHFRRYLALFARATEQNRRYALEGQAQTCQP